MKGLLGIGLVAGLLLLSLPTPTVGADAKSVADGVNLYEEENYRDAMRALKPLAEQGAAEAQYYVGRMLEKGQGISSDKEQAVKWYQRSAERGYAKSQYRLAAAYAYGLAGMPNDEEQAAKWLQKSAEGGYPRAQRMLSRAYAEGRLGLPRDPERADYWAKRAESKKSKSP